MPKDDNNPKYTYLCRVVATLSFAFILPTGPSYAVPMTGDYTTVPFTSSYTLAVSSNAQGPHVSTSRRDYVFDVSDFSTQSFVDRTGKVRTVRFGPSPLGGPYQKGAFAIATFDYGISSKPQSASQRERPLYGGFTVKYSQPTGGARELFTFGNVEVSPFDTTPTVELIQPKAKSGSVSALLEDRLAYRNFADFNFRTYADYSDYAVENTKAATGLSDVGHRRHFLNVLASGEIKVSLDGVLNLRVEDPAADDARANAEGSLEISRKLEKLFDNLSRLEAVSSLYQGLKQISDAFRESRPISPGSVLSVSVGVKGLNSKPISDQISYGVENTGPQAIAVVNRELEKLQNEPTGVLDWIGATRVLVFMEQVTVGEVERIINDPPRFDYDQTFTPTLFVLDPKSRSYLGEPISSYLEARMRLLQISSAIVVANERYQGALIQSDAEAADKQSQLIERLASNFEFVSAEATQTYYKLSIELDQRKEAAIERITDLEDFIDQLRSNSADFEAVAFATGLDATDLSEALSHASSVSGTRPSIPIELISWFTSDTPLAPQFNDDDGDAAPSPVPLPHSGTGLVLGALALFGLRSRRRASSQCSNSNLVA